jgi:cytochrome c-type biogenesis protein
LILTAQVDILAAFFAGLLTFFTPCTLPLLPGWFALVTGLDNPNDSVIKLTLGQRVGIFVSTLFFVLGFSLIFVAMGAMASALGDFLWEHQQALRWIGGSVMTVFGLYLLGIIKPKAFLSEHRFQIKGRPAGLLGALVVGMAFSAGWTPCSGPVLASLLTLAATQENLARGTELLIFFSIGLSLPFLLLSVMWSSLLPKMRKLLRFTVWTNRILGVLMLILAVLVFADKLSLLNFGY